MKPIRRDITIEPGSYTSQRVVLKAQGQPLDLTGSTAYLHVRAYDGTLLIELTEENAGIVIEPAAGAITYHFLATRTKGIAERTGYWEFRWEPAEGPDYAIELYHGKVTFGREDIKR